MIRRAVELGICIVLAHLLTSITRTTKPGEIKQAWTISVLKTTAIPGIISELQKFGWTNISKICESAK